MPIPSCPPEIKQLMNTPVTWEGFLGFDGHAEPSYAPAMVLKCFLEEHGMVSGGVEAFRGPDGTVVEPVLDLYFNGDDPNVRNFKMYDRFTPTSIGVDQTQKLQAVFIATFYGPPFDNRNPWVVRITL